ncbi:transposase [Streptomyces sp. NPDC048219]|uniref:transposase n=1 Tax=unclassified Streptomyces TaxID=2593676 RepID=UPI00343E86C1
MDFGRRQVACPNGRTSTTLDRGPAPAMAPYTVVRFASHQCDPCPDRPPCTQGKSARTVNFLPRHLHELRAGNRTD